MDTSIKKYGNVLESSGVLSEIEDDYSDDVFEVDAAPQPKSVKLDQKMLEIFRRCDVAALQEVIESVAPATEDARGGSIIRKGERNLVTLIQPEYVEAAFKHIEDGVKRDDGVMDYGQMRENIAQTRRFIGALFSDDSNIFNEGVWYECVKSSIAYGHDDIAMHLLARGCPKEGVLDVFFDKADVKNNGSGEMACLRDDSIAEETPDPRAKINHDYFRKFVDAGCTFGPLLGVGGESQKIGDLYMGLENFPALCRDSDKGQNFDAASDLVGWACAIPTLFTLMPEVKREDLAKFVRNSIRKSFYDTPDLIDPKEDLREEFVSYISDRGVNVDDEVAAVAVEMVKSKDMRVLEALKYCEEQNIELPKINTGELFEACRGLGDVLDANEVCNKVFLKLIDYGDFEGNKEQYDFIKREPGFIDVAKAILSNSSLEEALDIVESKEEGNTALLAVVAARMCNGLKDGSVVVGDANFIKFQAVLNGQKEAIMENIDGQFGSHTTWNGFVDDVVAKMGSNGMTSFDISQYKEVLFGAREKEADKVVVENVARVGIGDDEIPDLDFGEVAAVKGKSEKSKVRNAIGRKALVGFERESVSDVLRSARDSNVAVVLPSVSGVANDELPEIKSARPRVLRSGKEPVGVIIPTPPTDKPPESVKCQSSRAGKAKDRVRASETPQSALRRPSTRATTSSVSLYDGDITPEAPEGEKSPAFLPQLKQASKGSLRPGTSMRKKTGKDSPATQLDYESNEIEI